MDHDSLMEQEGFLFLAGSYLIVAPLQRTVAYPRFVPAGLCVYKKEKKENEINK